MQIERPLVIGGRHLNFYQKFYHQFEEDPRSLLNNHVHSIIRMFKISSGTASYTRLGDGKR